MNKNSFQHSSLNIKYIMEHQDLCLKKQSKTKQKPFKGITCISGNTSGGEGSVWPGRGLRGGAPLSASTRVGEITALLLPFIL